MRAIAVIPARFASVRFPGKPLARIGDRPLVQWVWEAATAADVFECVVVATESEEIAACVRAFGGAVELTSPEHRTGTDRVAEVARGYRDADVIANVQGDQPFLTPVQLSALLRPYEDGTNPQMATVACPLQGDPHDRNTVKVVCDAAGYALYFSRAPVPFSDAAGAEYLHHLGLYAFQPAFLETYASFDETELEARERLEQLRALAHGCRIAVTVTDEPVLEVNTPDDLERAQELVRAVTR